MGDPIIFGYHLDVILSYDSGDLIANKYATISETDDADSMAAAARIAFRQFSTAHTLFD
jgi:hypothetical protein